MIGSLEGKVGDIAGSTALIEAHGVGYEVYCSLRCLEKLALGVNVRIVVYTDVKQDSIRLFGFEDRLEKQVFLLLLEVKGVGPRTAADIISHIDKLELLRAISAGDLDRLQGVKGIGKKTAERIVVELRDKVGNFVIDRGGSNVAPRTSGLQPVDDAVEALQALGFLRRDAEKAVQAAAAAVDLRNADSSRVVKEALRFV